MEEMKKTIIISDASISDGGKTTIVEKLHKELPISEAPYIDEYDVEGPESVLDWMNRGSD